MGDRLTLTKREDVQWHTDFSGALVAEIMDGAHRTPVSHYVEEQYGTLVFKLLESWLGMVDIRDDDTVRIEATVRFTFEPNVAQAPVVD
jgi:hypothetical protein